MGKDGSNASFTVTEHGTVHFNVSELHRQPSVGVWHALEGSTLA